MRLLAGLLTYIRKAPQVIFMFLLGRPRKFHSVLHYFEIKVVLKRIVRLEGLDVPSLLRMISEVSTVS